MNTVLKCLMINISLLGLICSVSAGEVAVTFRSLVEEVTDADALARWPQIEYTCKQASSYDRGKVAPDKPGWFGNNDRNQYIRTEKNEERTEHVMMDVEGPGVIVRFWIVSNDAKRGKVRIYLDGAKEPVSRWPSRNKGRTNSTIGNPRLLFLLNGVGRGLR